MAAEERRDIETAMAESLKLLMKSESFDKITIKQITDGAGVIRVTFYNHFQDKYDLLGWIFRKQVIAPDVLVTGILRSYSANPIMGPPEISFSG